MATAVTGPAVVAAQIHLADQPPAGSVVPAEPTANEHPVAEPVATAQTVQAVTEHTPAEPVMTAVTDPEPGELFHASELGQADGERPLGQTADGERPAGRRRRRKPAASADAPEAFRQDPEASRQDSRQDPEVSPRDASPPDAGGS